MKAALRFYFWVDEPYDPEKGLLRVTFKKKRSGMLQEMNIKYCPFCGTRVALGLVDGLDVAAETGRALRTGS